MELEFDALVWEWRGPAPYVFASVPEELVDVVRDGARMLSYGWGVVPVTVTIGATTVTTSLFPRDGGYAVPLKLALRLPEGVELGDEVRIRLRFDA